MELNLKTFRLLSPHGCFLKAAGNCLLKLRSFSSSKLPPSDPPCQHNDPDCHTIDDPCESARNVFKHVLPYDLNMNEIKRQRLENLLERPCCVLRSAAKEPCPSWVARKRKKVEDEKPPFRSMWEPAFWPYQSNCTDLLPRFDAMYYEPSDKTRLYQRTWAECPPVRERLKKVCCLDGIQLPEVLKRLKLPCPVVTCQFDYSRMRHICQNAEIDPTSKCCKIHWPCCKPANCTVDCRPTGRKQHCKRLRAPHRSYSEIFRHVKPRRLVECPSNMSMCDMYRLQNRYHIYGIKGTYC